MNLLGIRELAFSALDPYVAFIKASLGYLINRPKTGPFNNAAELAALNFRHSRYVYDSHKLE